MDSAFLPRNGRFFVAALLRMTAAVTLGLIKVLLTITENCEKGA
jgi:hypothetical protein